MDTSNNPNWVEIGSLIISIIAIFWAWLTDRKLKKQQSELNKQQEQINKQQLIINDQQLAKNKSEEDNKKKANLIAETEGKYINAAIRIWNQGLGEARNVTFLSQGNTIKPSNNRELPIKSIPPMESVRIFCNFQNQEDNVTLQWEDDFSKDNEKEQSILLKL